MTPPPRANAHIYIIWGVGAAQGHGDVELIPCFCAILEDWCGGSAVYIYIYIYIYILLHPSPLKFS